MLDGATNDISLCAGNNVRDAIPRVDDGSGQRSVGLLAGRPGSCEGEHGLHGDVETFDVERFKEDFGRLLAVFGWVERWFGLNRYFSCQRCGKMEKGETD